MQLRHLSVLLGLLLWLTACKPEPLPELVHFVFLLPASITPGADTVARGDTLWLSVDFSDSLLDLRSNQRYRVRREDLELTTSVGFRKLLGPDQFPGSFAQGFTVVNQVGQLQPGGSTFSRFLPLYDGHRYRARIGIVPQFTGVYALNLLKTIEAPSSLRFLAVPPDSDGNPRQATLDGIYYIINGGNVHFPLQQQHSRVASTKPDAPEGAVYYEQKSTFAFVVR